MGNVDNVFGSAGLLFHSYRTGPMLEGSRVDVAVIPGPLLLADLESVLLDAESDVVIHSSWQFTVPLMEGEDGDGGENNVKTELPLFSLWLVFILSCFQCCVQSKTVSMGLSRISCLIYRC